MAVHAGETQVDLTLPTAVPIAALIPAILDIVGAAGGTGGPSVCGPDLRDGLTDDAARPVRLSLPGAAALDSSKTLAQHRIREGSLLLVTRAAVEPPAPRFDDPAELVSTTVRAVAEPWTAAAARMTAALTAAWLCGIGIVLAAQWNSFFGAGLAGVGSGAALLGTLLTSRAYSGTGAMMTLGLLTVGLAGAAGFLIVPGAPGAPGALLGATAAAAAGVLVGQLTGRGGPVLAAVCCLSALIAAAALGVVLTGASTQVAGAVSAVTSMGLLHSSGRISVLVAGLGRSGWADADENGAVFAHRVLTGLVAAFAALALLGVVGTVAGVLAGSPPRLGGAVFGAACGLALLLQARSHSDRRQIVALAAAGITCLGASLVAASVAAPQQTGWLGTATVLLAAATLRWGFAAPALSPSARRALDLLDYLALIALVPSAGWVCGWYQAIRGLGLA